MLQSITHRTTHSISNSETRNVSFKYLNKKQNLAENTLERIYAVLPNALFNLAITEGDDSFVDLVKQAQLKIKSGQFDDREFHAMVQELRNIGFGSTEFCRLFAKSIAIVISAHGSSDSTHSSYFLEGLEEDFVSFFTKNITIIPEDDDEDFDRHLLETRDLSSFMELIHAREELDKIVRSSPLLPFHTNENQYFDIENLSEFLMHLSQRASLGVSCVAEKSTIEKFMELLESVELRSESEKTGNFPIILCRFLGKNPLNLEDHSLIRLIKILERLPHPCLISLNFLSDLNETVSPLLKKAALTLIQKSPWEQSEWLEQALLSKLIVNAHLGNTEEDIEMCIQLISRLDLNSDWVQNELFNASVNNERSIFKFIVGNQNLDFVKKTLFLNRIFSLLEHKKIKLTQTTENELIRFPFVVPMIFTLVQKKHTEFQEGSDFITRLMNKNQLLVMRYFQSVRTIMITDERRKPICLFFQNRFHEMVISKLNPSTLEQFHTLFSIENPSEFFTSLYPMVSTDEKAMIILDDGYIENLNKNKPSDLNRFCYLSKSEQGFFELQAEGNRPRFQEIFKLFPELNSFYKKHENTKVIANFFRKLNLKDILPAFEDSLTSEKSATKFLSTDESVDDTAQQEKFSEIFACFLTDPSKILASGGTSIEADAQLAREIVVTEEFLALIFSSFEDLDSSSSVEKSRLLFALSGIFYQLSSQSFFGTEENSLKALRNIALGLLNKAVEINPYLITPEQWSDYASRSLEAIVHKDPDSGALTKAFACTERLASMILAQVRLMGSEDPNSIVSGLIPIAWKAD